MVTDFFDAPISTYLNENVFRGILGSIFVLQTCCTLETYSLFQRIWICSSVKMRFSPCCASGTKDFNSLVNASVLFTKFLFAVI